MRHIEDFKEGERIVDHYLCKQKITAKSKAGKNYLSLLLFDRTGTIQGKVWDLNNSIQNFNEGDFIKIDGEVQSYQNELQLKIVKIRQSIQGEYNPSDYIPTTEKDVDVLFSQLKDFINSVRNPYLSKLLENLFITNTKAQELFKKHSAAKNLHHSYLGGLLEHTLSVTQISDFMASRYKHVNRDILITASLLHDYAKIYELSPLPENDYTDEGQLLGHIVIGYEIISEEIRKIDGFPEKLGHIIKHCVLSHHGEFEYGSPKRPKVIEAFLLHCIDNMDAKVKAFEEAISADNTQGSWIGFNKMFQRNIRKSDV